MADGGAGPSFASDPGASSASAARTRALGLPPAPARLQGVKGDACSVRPESPSPPHAPTWEGAPHSAPEQRPLSSSGPVASSANMGGPSPRPPTEAGVPVPKPRRSPGPHRCPGAGQACGEASSGILRLDLGGRGKPDGRSRGVPLGPQPASAPRGSRPSQRMPAGPAPGEMRLGGRGSLRQWPSS